MEIQTLLEIAADTFGDRPVLAGPDWTLSYAGLLARARSTAAVLSGYDCENVAFLGLNTPAFPICMFASALAGRPFAPLNYRLSDSDLRAIVARLAPAVLVADDDMMARVEGIDGVTVISRTDLFAAAEAVDATDFHTDAAHPIAALLFTSGTSGQPKAAVLRHENLTSYVIGTVEFASADEDEIILSSVPPYHIAAISGVLTAIYAGRTIVPLAAFTPDEWVDTVARHMITNAMVVPTMLGRILDVLDRRGETLPSLRALSYGGGRMPVTTVTRAMTMLPEVNFVNAYGLTETSSTISVLDPEAHRAALHSDDPQVRQQLGSVGRPIPGVEVRIVDSGHNDVPAGVVGEILVRGDQVSGEYVGQSALTADGWFPTKDAGWIDSHGFLYVDGRLDDVIVRGGENISPGEIEERIRDHPSVADVAIVGVPDREWGERIVAILVLKDPSAYQQDHFQDWLKQRLRSNMMPQEYQYRDELPYNETGKLLRRVLRAVLTET